MTAPGDVFTVQTPEQAAMLLDLKYADLMARLMGGEVSAAQLARDVGAPLGRVHYQLGRMVDAGVVQVCGETARGGRPVKRYAAVSGAFHVPYALTSNATLAELMSRMYQPFVERSVAQLAREAARRGVSAVTLQLNEHGELQFNFAATTDVRRASLGRWGELRLSTARAEELRSKLEALVEEYAASDELDGRPYLFGTILVQGSREDGTR